MHAWNCRSDLLKGIGLCRIFSPDGRGMTMLDTAGSGSTMHVASKEASDHQKDSGSLPHSDRNNFEEDRMPTKCFNFTLVIWDKSLPTLLLLRSSRDIREQLEYAYFN
ncbi:hypothetical protein PoB_004706100 [Plakobranchus ocellatus]|uniref:Uncharacterized protein n=1 Tax=Plakobranchus ocellatus TaxID=259542 RepID=A0AAV4BJH7_9GAST|nr:hypothetical protein PoB_004706100 [Plakobranchus ocellatus]